MVLDNDNPMHMIGHHHIRVQGSMGIMGGNVQPAPFRNLACIVQPHFPFQHLPEQAFPVVGANGNEIGAGLGIVVAPQAEGAAAQFRP